MWYQHEGDKKIVIVQTEKGWLVTTKMVHHDIETELMSIRFKNELDCTEFVHDFFKKN